MGHTEVSDLWSAEYAVNHVRAGTQSVGMDVLSASDSPVDMLICQRDVRVNLGVRVSTDVREINMIYLLPACGSRGVGNQSPTSSKASEIE
ncbi:MAG: hypothetical protein ACYSW3_09190 [Planctomycetota bacterium]